MSENRPIYGWGRYPGVPGTVARSENFHRAAKGSVLSRGLGRAYGDAAVPAKAGERLAGSTLADRILSFDEQTGVICTEAGVTLRTLRGLYLKRGWFSPVSPGTQYVTVGGMVASDIHGKNHHVDGTFGAHVLALTLCLADGSVVCATRDQHPDLFFATIGGMGLTGHILDVTFQMAKIASPWIYEESERFGSLEDVFTALNSASEDWPMTVAWIDTSIRGPSAGRGIVMRGRWAEAGEAPAHVPPIKQGPVVPNVFPSWVMNSWSIRVLNWLFWRKHPRRTQRHVISPETWFWQLDLLQEWNRGYGSAGFTQYQCVMPSDVGLYREFLELFQKHGGSSFVTVFKDCGEAGEGLLSFPMRGTSMALDIPIFDGVQTLVRELNAFVIAQGGRVYLAKDALTSAEEFRQMYPLLPDFEAARDRWDPDGLLNSAQSVRLLGERNQATRTLYKMA
jgi:decaprenylphospho-beta-D-ribofuranose 2-oxidase